MRASRSERPETSGGLLIPRAREGAVYRLLRTDAGAAPLVLRTAVAGAAFPLGAGMLLGWFGGPGIGETMRALTGTVGLPVSIAILVIGIEFYAPLALLLGGLTRAAAAAIGAVAAGAVVSPSLLHALTAAGPGAGAAVHLLLLGAAVVLAVRGAGAASIDRLLTCAAGADDDADRSAARAAPCAGSSAPQPC